jgi:molybdopterin converting factor small subunit
MQVSVEIPASLRQFSNGDRRVVIDCDSQTTVSDVFERLHRTHPGVVERALDEQRNVREHVNVFVDGESIRAGRRLGLMTPVDAGSEIWILPAVSGGSG